MSDTSNVGQGRAVLVTGASSGIGRACALHLDAIGFRVFATYRKPEDADSLRAAGSDRLSVVRLDVTEPDAIEAARVDLVNALGGDGLHGLVNNAGIAVAAPLEFLPTDALRQQLEVNVVGQMAVTQAFLPQLRAARGRIVNVSSISGRMAAPFVGAYAASKYALEALSDALRIELRPWDIRVALIEPGAIETPIWETSGRRAEAMRADYPPEAEEMYGPALQGLLRRIANMKGTPTGPVVDAIVDALTADRPRVRYVVGTDAKTRLWLTWLPDRLRDWIIAKTIYG